MSLRISCTCGNTELLSNNMTNFNICLTKFSDDSKTGKIQFVCQICGQVTKEILIGN